MRYAHAELQAKSCIAVAKSACIAVAVAAATLDSMYVPGMRRLPHMRRKERPQQPTSEAGHGGRCVKDVGPAQRLVRTAARERLRQGGEEKRGFAQAQGSLPGIGAADSQSHLT